MQTIIDCQNLIKIHKQGNLEVVALQGLDLTMEQGEFVSIVGASGAGKSTLLTILAGFDTPSAGKAVVAERDLTEISPKHLTKYYRRDVGFVWQDFTRNLVPYLNAIQNVEAEKVLLLPNNSNVILAARQASELSGKHVIVVPTKTVPQGITALLAFNYQADIEINAERMTQAAGEIQTVEVTRAVRSTQINGIDVRSPLGKFVDG